MDALDRELSAALDVDPSPEFVARVRARIAMEPPPARWLMPRVPRLLMTAGVALAVIVVAAVLNPPREQVAAPVPVVAGAVGRQLPAPRVEPAVAVERPHRVRVRRRPAEIQLVSINELPDAASGVVVAAMRFDEVVTMTGVHP